MGPNRLKWQQKWLIGLCSLMLLSTILITTGNVLAKSKFDPQLPPPDTLEIIDDEFEGF